MDDKILLIFKETTLLNNSWLSEFSTAEDCFLISIINQKFRKEVIDSEGWKYWYKRD